jgi:hypothetical protein
MSIRRFFTKDIEIKRERDLGGNKRALSTTGTADGWFEDLQPDQAQQLGIIGQRAWRFWFDLDESILEGDVLVDEDGTEYSVRGITKRAIGTNQHLEVLAVEHNA